MLVGMESIQYEDVTAHAHSVSETIDAWNDENSQGNLRARSREQPCVVVRCNLHDAVVLSQVFHRFFADESCCHYDRDKGILSMYCGNASSAGRDLASRMFSVAESFGLNPV